MTLWGELLNHVDRVSRKARRREGFIAALRARRCGTTQAKHAGRCSWCGRPYAKGETVVFTRRPSATVHTECACEAAMPEPTPEAP